MLALSLLDGGADLNARDVITPLYAAQEYVRSSKQRHSLLRRMLRRGAHVDGPTQDGTTVCRCSFHCTVLPHTTPTAQRASPEHEASAPRAERSPPPAARRR